MGQSLCPAQSNLLRSSILRGNMNLFDKMDRYPKPNDAADRVKRKMAHDFVVSKMSVLFTGEQIQTWTEIGMWLSLNVEEITQDEPLDYLFTYYRNYSKKLPDEFWVKDLENKIPGAQAVLLKFFEAQDRVYSAKDSDGHSQPSGYRNF